MLLTFHDVHNLRISIFLSDIKSIRDYNIATYTYEVGMSKADMQKCKCEIENRYNDIYYVKESYDEVMALIKEAIQGVMQQ